MKTFLPLISACILLSSCQRSTVDTAALQQAAQFYVERGGLSIHSTADYSFNRPCLDSLNMPNTVLGGMLGGPEALVQFIEQHKLATTVRTDLPGDYVRVVLTPRPPYEKNWLGQGNFKAFCFGRFKAVKVEAVSDAQETVAGRETPYLIAGTTARPYRLTFKLTDLPDTSVINGLKDQPALLRRGAMPPADYEKEFTVVAMLPADVKNFNVSP
jgi:hypothetical protein